jgi:crossover junction endodeoxyribonuclease RuvC
VTEEAAPSLIILGIDPGTAATGFGVVERRGSLLRAIDYGCIETAPTDSLAERLLQIHEAIAELIDTHQPAYIAVERLFFNKNVQTAFAVGQARGAVLLTAAQHGRPVLEFTPSAVKIAVTGYGRAPKDQVQRMVQIVLGLPDLPRPDDAADALAIAICLAHTHRSAA